MPLQIKTIVVTPFRQNCTLLWDDNSREGVLIDAGGDAPYLLEAAAARGIRLSAVWLTHGHLDHAGGADDIRATAGVPIIGPHREDRFLLDSLPETTAAYAAYGFPLSAAFLPDRWLEEGDSLTVGGYRFDVLHIPGHTPGHVVFYCASEALLLAGDVLFRESVGRTDFPRGNHQDLIDNIRSKLLPLPENVRVLPGHGSATTIGHEKRHNPFL